jgi:hypothetical protein
MAASPSACRVLLRKQTSSPTDAMNTSSFSFYSAFWLFHQVTKRLPANGRISFEQPLDCGITSRFQLKFNLIEDSMNGVMPVRTKTFTNYFGADMDLLILNTKNFAPAEVNKIQCAIGPQREVHRAASIRRKSSHRLNCTCR